MFQQKKRDSDDGTNWTAVGLAAALLTVFVGAYLWGSRRQEAVGTKQTGELKQRGKYVRQQLRQCQNSSRLSDEKASELQGEVAALWSKNRVLEEDNERLLALNDDLEQKRGVCMEKTQLTKQTWKEDDQANSGLAWQLQGETARLRQQVNALDKTTGMRSTILLALVKALSKEHLELKEGLTGSSRGLVVDTKYVDGLVAKWKKIDADLVAQGKPGPMTTREGDILPFNVSADFTMTSKREVIKVTDRYDPDRLAKAIFIPRRGPDGKWQLPGWNGRQGTQTIRKGTYVRRKKFCPETSINRQMRVLYEYALCALSRNVTKFAFPTMFKRCKDCVDEFLHNYVETPLVLFCDDCTSQHNSNAFKLLCQSTGAEQEYGSELFWRMRSRLLFKGTFRTLAENWSFDNFFRAAGMNPDDKDKRWGKTLSVRLSSVGNPEWSKTCEAARQHKRPILSFTKLLKGKATEYSADVDEQCSPPLSVVKAKINEKIAELGTEKVRVYISTGRGMSDKQWYELERGITAPIYRRRPTERATEDDIVDTLIAASCDALILNRYDLKSTMILEAHMLYNDLKTTGVSVW
eukprot:TRINITY_DN3604_c4_g1_i1.p1 TRINITY_DN3604_c4_g1~~TRINITY_DN3604_c4_g1_i1.p1  ORF type:complete len:579 (+),score=203.34 TRINITY_DN3604_c4_g1_i1:142-1878(+)